VPDLPIVHPEGSWMQCRLLTLPGSSRLTASGQNGRGDPFLGRSGINRM
jgi:hypothetical protein